MNLKKLLSASLAIVALASCQTASDPYMELETKLLTLDSEGGTATVTLTSNVYYRVNNDCSDASGEHYWARISDTETNGDKTVLHFEVDANESTEERTGTVRFIGDDVTPLKLTLKQKGIVPKGIAPESAVIESTAVSAGFKVYGDRKWTATCSDEDVVISPASGFCQCCSGRRQDIYIYIDPESLCRHPRGLGPQCIDRNHRRDLRGRRRPDGIPWN